MVEQKETFDNNEKKDKASDIWESRGVIRRQRKQKKREEKAEDKQAPKMGMKGSGMHIDKRWSKEDENGALQDNE